MPAKLSVVTKPRRKTRSKRKTSAPKLSRTHQPDHLSTADWQAGLRRQFGREQDFVLKNLGDEPVFSEFAVTNPASGGHYRVAIRGAYPGDNYCACPDFATNELGTCKHIEFVLGRLERKRGGKTALKAGFHPPYSELYLRYGGQRRVCFRAGSDCPAGLAKHAARLFDPAWDWALPEAAFAELDAFLARAQKAGHELRCYDDALRFIADVRDRARRVQVLAQAYPQGVRSAALKKLLNTRLYPYQVEGALFAVRAGRALLADDMGLGKTVQAIAAAELFSKHFGVERVLVVCPASVKQQWQNEILRFCGREARIVGGSAAQRRAQYADVLPLKITNYEALDADLDAIRAWAPELLIVDEAQRIKNWNTIAARTLKRIDSPYALVLTGTPLENRLEELVSIVQFVDQQRLGPTWRLLQQHQTRDDDGRVIGYRDLDRIGESLAPIMLRRRKSEVLPQLPARVDNNIFVEMTPEQRAYHDENGAVVTRIVQRWRKTRHLSEADQRRLTCALQNMRMSCNSTFLLDQESDHGTKADELMLQLAEIFEQADAKVVIFSQWQRTHQLLVKRLRERGWEHVLFHGGVPVAKRGALIERFLKEPACRLFLATDAGSVGLNLQHAAAVVINMDLPWNPAILEQRIGRVYRLGQTRGVQVLNFVAENTIEHGMLATLAFKRSLFAGVLDGGDSQILLNGTRLSRFMDSVATVTTATPVQVEVPQIPATTASMQAVPAVTDAPPAGPTASNKAPEVPATARTPADDQASAQDNPWAVLLEAGRLLVDALQAPASGGNTAGNGPALRVERDPETGKACLKLPLPEPEAARKLASALGEFLATLR